ncbi:MAG: MFS transporter [Steroidobacteraceae bacterium]
MNNVQTGTGPVEPPREHTGRAEPASPAERWYVASMMYLVYTLSISDRSISTVLEPIRLDLNLSDANIAFLTGVSLAIFYIIFGFPLSSLIDRRSRRNIIDLIAWSALTVATGLARTYWQLLWARIGVGSERPNRVSPGAYIQGDRATHRARDHLLILARLSGARVPPDEVGR